MDLATLAKAQSVNRLALGVALIALPGLFGRIWSGGRVAGERARLVARALGVRDVALGAGGLLALREGDPRWASRAFGAQAAADAADVVAVLLARDALGRPAQAVAATVAAGSAGLAAASAWRLRSGG